MMYSEQKHENTTKYIKMRAIQVIILGLCITQTAYLQDINPGISLANVVKISTTEMSAIDHYTGVLENNPTNVKYLMLRSDMYRSAGMSTEAIRDLQTALSINPYAEIYTSRAVRRTMYPIKDFDYIKSKNMESDDPFFKSFVLMEQYKLKLEKENILDKYEIKSIVSLIDKGDYMEARHLLEGLDTSYYHNELYYDLLGVLEMKESKFESAIEHFDMAIELDPSFVVPYHNRAVAYKKIGKLDMSEKDFAKALKLNGDIAKIYFGKANLMNLKGDKKNAKHYYNQALNRSNYYPEAVSNYSLLLKSIGQYTDALIEMDSAIDDDPSLSSNYYIRAGIHFVYGNYKNAIQDLDQYLENEPEDEEALFFRGLSKMMLDVPTNGCYDMERGLELGYENENNTIYWHMCD